MHRSEALLAEGPAPNKERRRPQHTASWLVVLLLLAGCMDTPHSRSDTSDASDRVAVAPARVHKADSVRIPRSPDTARTRVAAGDVSDSAVGAPSTNELAELREELMIPVPGVTPEELVDSYNDARSGGRAHRALDIRAPRWTPVLSAADGRVLKLHTSKAGGLMVYATERTERFVLMYGHLQQYAEHLAEGAGLKRGDTLGFVGTTGNAPPDVPHLHFAIAHTADVTQWWTGAPVDPRPLLQP